MFPVSFPSGSWILWVDPRRCLVIDPVTSPTGMGAQQIHQEIHFKYSDGWHCGNTRSWLQQCYLSAFIDFKTGHFIS